MKLIQQKLICYLSVSKCVELSYVHWLNTLYGYFVLVELISVVISQLSFGSLWCFAVVLRKGENFNLIKKSISKLNAVCPSDVKYMVHSITYFTTKSLCPCL